MPTLKQPKSPYESERVESVAVADIHTDISYQRPINKGFIDKVCRDLDMRAFGVLLVALRPDELLYVCDGQHRLEIARQLKWLNVPCVVVLCEDAEDEARLFLNANARSAVHALDRHRAAVCARDERALQLEAAVQAADLEIGTRKDGDPSTIHHVCAVVALQVVLAGYGPMTLTRALRLLRDAWHGEIYHAQWIKAAARVIAALSADGFEDREIIRRASTKTVESIATRAAQTAPQRPGVDDIAFSIVWAFNTARGRQFDPFKLDAKRDNVA